MAVFPTQTATTVADEPTRAAVPEEATNPPIATAEDTQTPTATMTVTVTATATVEVTPSATITDTVTPTVTQTDVPTSESSAFEALGATAAVATVLPPGFEVGGTPVNLPSPGPIGGTPSSLQPAIETFGGGAAPTAGQQVGGVSRPLVTSTPAPLVTPTPVSQQSLGGCSDRPYPGGFQTLREARPNIQTVLGCLYGDAQRVASVYQPLERGFMLYLGAPAEVVVVGSADESFRVYSNTFNPNAEPASGGEQPPNGLYELTNALGKVWRGDRGVRNGLGWGTAPPSSGEAVYVRMTTGWLISAPQRGDILLLADNLKRWWGLPGSY